MTNVREYTQPQLHWLASHLEASILANGKAERTKIIKDFNAFYKGADLTIGKLSRLYMNNGGNQEEFIKKFSKHPDDQKAKLDGVIAQAFLDWNPQQASFATVYALAAKMVNEAHGTHYSASEIQGMLSGRGGPLDFLLDCNIDKQTALQAVGRAKEKRSR